MYWLLATTDEYTDEEYTQIYTLLSPSRKARVDRLQREVDRRCSLAGELSIRKLLTKNCYVTTPIVHCDERGKPFINTAPLQISIAHCDNFVVCAADSEPIGIDIERIKPIKSSLIHRVCTPDERAFVLGGHVIAKPTITDQTILRRFFEVWTAKEAFFKKIGTGITNFQKVEISTLKRKVLQSDTYIVQVVY